VKFVKAPDFPTGGIICEDKKDIVKTYETGRGSFKIRAKWKKEDLQYGNYQIVVTEIPYQVVKSKLIEKIADLLNAKKLPLLSDIRDESAEDIRIILEPKNRTTDPELLMNHLFKLTDLEAKFNLNMNVLFADGTPKVGSLKEILQAFLDFRKNVLIRRTKHRLEKIADRIEVLGGYLIAYLNIDEVIHIIRENDEPKPILMERFKLSDRQAEAILNMKLRSLRKLEEIEIKKEDEALKKEQVKLNDLLSGDDKLLSRIAEEIEEVKKKLGKSNPIGKRRSKIDAAVEDIDLAPTQFIEKEPITVILSEMGWIRALKGHLEKDSISNFKEGDKLKFALHTYTTDKILFFATNGKFYTILGDKITGGRGYGDPLRLMIDLDGADIVNAFVYKKDEKIFVASKAGYGFLAEAENVLAETKKGKSVLSVGKSGEAIIAEPVAGRDSVAVIGNNRKLLIFKVDELPVLNKGKGVILQKYKDKNAHVSDIKILNVADGLSWKVSGKSYQVKDLRMWISKRASVGSTPPEGFSRLNKF
jgi:topoisomerase-4 subunit A